MTPRHSPIRNEVLDYLTACANLLLDKDGSHQEFMQASEVLFQKGDTYTDEERVLVQEMLHRVSAKFGQ